MLPSLFAVDAREEQRAKISPELARMMNTASSDEYVTAIVRFHGRADTRLYGGSKPRFNAELRNVAERAQRPVVDYLDRPTVRQKVKNTRRFWIDNIMLVTATPDVIENLAERPDVVEVFENFTVTLPPMPKSDGHPFVGQAQSQLWDSITKIGAKQVWSTYGFDGTGVVMGGIDTGVEVDHPDLIGKMVTTNPADPTYPGGWGEFDSNGNLVPGSVPHDTDGHGTHTTGTQIGGNASGWDIGVAPGAHFMHALVLPGGSGSFAQVIGGMEWIVDPDGNPATDDGCDVVNMSLGATGTYPDMIVPVDNFIAMNVFPAISIGNSGPGASTTGSPGNVPSAFGVGAVDSMDVIASFSSRGPVTWNNPPYVGTYIKPDIAAPGVKIYSSVPGGTWEWNYGAGDWSGTSMAAPHMAGVAALMKQANPSMDVELMKQLVGQTAVDLGDPGMDNNYGWGRVNAFAAVTAALAGVGTLEGTVYSSAGPPVDNAKILIVETGQRVYSDVTGHYTMQVVAGDVTLEVSRFGYETQTIPVTIVADMTTTQDVTLAQLPSGNVAGYVTDGETGMGIAADITVKLAGEAVVWSSTDPSTGAYDITLPVGTYDLVFAPVFPYPHTTRTGIVIMEAMTTPLDISLDAAKVLIVDDDGGAGYEVYYEAAVAAAGRSFLTVTGAPTAEQMAEFESVVWLTGNDYTTTLSAADQVALAAYLDAGGRLFLSGQDIGYDIHTEPFYADYLHAAYVQDNVGLRGCLGVPTSPVGAGFAFEIQGGTGAGNQGYPSEIDPLYPALPAFVYDEAVLPSGMVANDMSKGSVDPMAIQSTGTAGLTVDTGGYKIVYFAFGFEAIATETDRTAVMARVLDWLLGYPEIAHTPLGDTENTSDPYRVAAAITSAYFDLDLSSFAVVYDAGAGDVVLPMTPTGIPDEYEAFIPAQPVDTEVAYYITASDVAGHTSTHPLAAPGARHVFKVGWDTEPPVVLHNRHYNTNDLTGPYQICAEVTDNIGVETVWLMWSRNGGMFHRQLMEPQGGGMYCGAIPGPSEVGDVYEYHLLAMDESYRGNVTRVPDMGEYSFEIVEYFLWDFEYDDGGFTVGNDVWEWGAPTSGPGGAHSGANVWATVLGGPYPNSADATLTIPAITLAADKPYAMMSLWHWYEMEGSSTRYDGGNVKVSIDDGATWTVITPVGGYDGTASSSNAGIPGEPCFSGYDDMFWQQELFDLSPFTGNTVTLRYHFGSDGSVNKAGWYIDDVMVRSTDTDDVPPTISGTVVPASSFDAVGPYGVTTTVTDFLGTVAGVWLGYSVDGGAWVEMPMTAGTGDDWSASIPGQPNGSRIRLYVRAEDSSANEAYDPGGAPGDWYEFSILPSAPVLVMQGTSSSTPLTMFQEAFGDAGIAADFWYRYTQGWLTPAQLALYKVIVLDESSGLTSTQMADLGAWLDGGTQEAKRRLWIMGRDLGYNSTTRPWLEQYMRASYVQDDPAFREITGYPGEPIGAGETFVIVGSYPDEIQRSTAYPGGELVYQYTGTGTAAVSRDELAGEYEKEEKDWDGIMPYAPKSLDAGAAIKYNAETYRSVYFSFNLYYVQEPERRAGIVGRALGWLAAPDIVHQALHDTEDTLSAYQVLAEVYSETLDLSRVYLVYDVGAGPVTVTMAPTANPNEYSAAIPAQGYGTLVQYYLQASNTDGNTSYHPHGAPAVQHTFEVTADNTPPEIVHIPLGNSADMAGPWTVSAVVTDNVGVDPTAVRLIWNKNGGANTSVAMTNTSGDTYEASIPGPAVLGDVFNYYITARDVATIPNTAREPATGYHSFEIVDYYAWDFEANDGGFAATGPDWEWGEPTNGPGSAYSGVNVWGTRVTADYSASSNSMLDLPAVTVPTSAPSAVLSWWQWYYIETNYDGGNVKISTDGGSTWTILLPDIGYTGTASSYNAGIPGEACFTGYYHNTWEKATVNLTPYIGQSVIIRFHFGSDSSVNRAGWFIDDVRIEGVADTEGPLFVSTDVPESTFDTTGPYTVTSEIVDALSGVASAELHYSVDDGMTWNDLAMSPAGGNDWSCGIPGQPSGTRIRFWLEAADANSNGSVDPAGAPGAWYEFGIMPSGDYLVIQGGGSYTPATTWQAAFTTIGETVDFWNWDALGLPTLEMLLAYTGVIVDESWYLDTSQMTLLGTFLGTDDGVRKQVFFAGRDLSYGSTARPWMEQYTGAAYVKDDPSWRRLDSTPGDPIGNDESFVIAGSYPDELQLSTAWPGGAIVYFYSALNNTLDRFPTEEAMREFYEKIGKDWDPKLWPLDPGSSDAAAGIRFVGPYHNSVYFSFQFNYIQEETRRAEILGRVLAWLGTASGLTTDMADRTSLAEDTPPIPDELTLLQNYPNPFNPVTRIQFGVPAGYDGAVELRIYNVKGELVTTLFSGTTQPGYHTFEWNGLNNGGRQVSSGIYFCRFCAGDTKIVKKMVLLR
jgi:subtilisin family serine protease